MRSVRANIMTGPLDTARFFSHATRGFIWFRRMYLCPSISAACLPSFVVFTPTPSIILHCTIYLADQLQSPLSCSPLSLSCRAHAHTLHPFFLWCVYCSFPD